MGLRLSCGFKLNAYSAYSSSNCQGCGRVKKRKHQQQVQASGSCTSSEDSTSCVFPQPEASRGKLKQRHQRVQACLQQASQEFRKCRGRCWQERVERAPDQQAVERPSSTRHQLRQQQLLWTRGSPARVHEAMAQALSAHRPRALADLVSGAGPEQTRRATTELQPIGRLREAWLAIESALGPEH